jgi:hypothetical protein
VTSLQDEDQRILEWSERWEASPKPIAEWVETEGIPAHLKPKVIRLLKTMALLRATARALRRDDGPVVERGVVVLLEDDVQRLSGAETGVVFVVRDQSGAEVIATEVEIKRQPLARPGEDDTYLRVAAY